MQRDVYTTHGHSQGLKISHVWCGVKNCAKITPTNTTNYIHRHFKRDRDIDVCERGFLYFGGMHIDKLYHIYFIKNS